MALAARAGSSTSQKLGTPSRSQTGATGLHALGPISAAFLSAFIGNWVNSRGAGIHMGSPSWNACVLRILLIIYCVAMSAIQYTLINFLTIENKI